MNAALAALLMQAAAVQTAPPIDERALGALVEDRAFSGDIQIADPQGGGWGYVGLLPQPYRGGDDGATWRWASVTKQVVAVLVMQEVAKGRIDLDRPIATYLPKFRSANAATVTVRQLLQHRSGLPNPDDSPAGPGGFPSYYQLGYTGSRDPLTGYCAGPVEGAAGVNWSYNNCDYLVLGALLEAVTGKTWATLVDERIAKPLEIDFLAAYPGEAFTRMGTIDGKPEPAIDLASYGAAAGLYGSIDALAKFDIALMEGKLIPPDALATLWQGDPALGYMALGQWVFEAPLKGCAKPVRIVERRGGVGGIEVRNFILPEIRRVVIVFSDRAPFAFGEIWQGSGFSHDLLSAAACGKGTKQ